MTGFELLSLLVGANGLINLVEKSLEIIPQQSFAEAKEYGSELRRIVVAETGRWPT